MKQTVFTRLLAVLLLATMLLCSFVACDKKGNEEESKEPEHVDYVSELKLDMNSDSVKQEVSVHIYIDGDTTHFFVDKSLIPEGYVKARYLGINTPESTGVVEPWGKKASNYTKTQLQKAEKIKNGIDKLDSLVLKDNKNAQDFIMQLRMVDNLKLMHYLFLKFYI